MIIGVGTDLCDIRRIEQTLARFGARFTHRLYDSAERERAERRGERTTPQARAAGYAQRFAAKEACAKALGTGFRQGVFWRDMVVGNLPSGKPTLTLKGGALARLRALTPTGLEAQVELSLTDEYPLAHGVVVIYAGPGAAPEERTKTA
ncbi:MAG: holo-ACP synthase [Rhodospirillales bacterium]